MLREITPAVARRRRITIGAAGALALVFAIWSYDACGSFRATWFEAAHGDDASAVLQRWQSYQAWHPTRHLWPAGTAQDEDRIVDEWRQRARQQEGDRLQAEIARRAADPDADPDLLWRRLQDFRTEFPDRDLTGELERVRSLIKSRRDERLAHAARKAYDELISSEYQGADLPALALRADRFLAEFLGSDYENDIRRRRAAYYLRIEDRDIEAARVYSAGYPLNFAARRAHYQLYLDKFPEGHFAKEASAALEAIDAQWDRHDFRAVRDRFLEKPADTAELVTRCRGYLAAHPQGHFTAAVADLLRWTERVTSPAEYRVVLRGGDFEHRIARFFSRGPDLSVELEVAGVRYGPSNIVVNRYDPDWDYEFPRRIRWKLGDRVVIRVTDHDWKDRVVVEIASDENEPLAMRLLSGEAWSGRNHLRFESDFTMPTLPQIE